MKRYAVLFLVILLAGCAVNAEDAGQHALDEISHREAVTLEITGTMKGDCMNCWVVDLEDEQGKHYRAIVNRDYVTYRSSGPYAYLNTCEGHVETATDGCRDGDTSIGLMEGYDEPNVCCLNIVEQLPESCHLDDDCFLPGDWAVRSVCPYDTICYLGTCNVFCPEGWEA